MVGEGPNGEMIPLLLTEPVEEVFELLGLKTLGSLSSAVLVLGETGSLGVGVGASIIACEF